MLCRHLGIPQSTHPLPSPDSLMLSAVDCGTAIADLLCVGRPRKWTDARVQTLGRQCRIFFFCCCARFVPLKQLLGDHLDFCSMDRSRLERISFIRYVCTDATPHVQTASTVNIRHSNAPLCHERQGSNPISLQGQRYCCMNIV